MQNKNSLRDDLNSNKNNNKRDAKVERDSLVSLKLSKVKQAL
jgi:hypothetical protein